MAAYRAWENQILDIYNVLLRMSAVTLETRRGAWYDTTWIKKTVHQVGCKVSILYHDAPSKIHQTVQYVIWVINTACKNYVQCILDHIFTCVKLTEVRYILNYGLCCVKFEQNIKFVYAAILVTRFLQVTRIRGFQHIRQVLSFIRTRSYGKIV
jgi:hypothetical protein